MKKEKMRLWQQNNRIVTVTDKRIIINNRKKYIAYHCIAKGFDGWFPEDQVAPIIESVVADMINSTGQSVKIKCEFNHFKQEAVINITGGKPENLKEHHGLHMILFHWILLGMKSNNATIVETSSGAGKK